MSFTGLDNPTASRLQILRDEMGKTLRDKGSVRFLSKQNDSCVVTRLKRVPSLPSPMVNYLLG